MGRYLQRRIIATISKYLQATFFARVNPSPIPPSLQEALWGGFCLGPSSTLVLSLLLSSPISGFNLGLFVLEKLSMQMQTPVQPKVQAGHDALVGTYSFIKKIKNKKNLEKCNTSDCPPYLLRSSEQMWTPTK